ncbi:MULTISPECIES: response regulator [Hymenobacter]|uniref:Response regulator receiver domain-containing protein n=1 Tax=Hymenobacter mucosus TaxID=1411120 RepID=A0A238WY45_9BACT|nr:MULTISPECIES: response regulator [Hymenobacter]SNR51585.1 Response regulator receiver domain-containing protein [Hymenobacter mucosus]
MKILVVDDEKDVRALFEQRFRREIRSGQFAFTFAYSGEEALDFLHAHPSEVVLILSDINMPGMSGLELLKRIRQEYAAPPPPLPPQVMMITAYGDEESHQQALQLGANDFLTKPVDFTALKAKLTSMASHEN